MTKLTPPNTYRRTTPFLLALLALIVLGVAFGTDWDSQAMAEGQNPQQTPVDSNQQHNLQSDELWKDVSDSELLSVKTDEINAPQKHRVLRLEKSLFSRIVADAPLESLPRESRPEVVLSLPLPNGRLSRFEIVESPVLSDELAAKFPEIKTYSGQSLDDPTATVRFSWTPKGLNAFIISTQGSVFIAPASEPQTYVSYYTHHLKAQSFQCSAGGEADKSTTATGDISEPKLAINTSTLRRYRLAVSVTREFIFAVGGETTAGAGTFNAVTNYINNVRAIYEREIGVSFSLVVLNPAHFNFLMVNGDLATMNQQNQFFLDNLNIPGFSGSASYDVGFALGHAPLPGGLVSTLGASCQFNQKARGSAVVPGPSFNDYWGTIVIAHELGHMFGAVHTFTPIHTTNPQCIQQTAPDGRVEPGSGSTIMSYAGNCDPDRLFTGEPNTAANSFFHIDSLLRIRNHKNFFSGCGQTVSTGNSPPIITNPGSGGNIPILTPFTLTAAASDPNGNPITYAWEQLDTGGTLFRTYVPSSSGSRTFPSLPFILNNANNVPHFVNGFFSGELLPSVSRPMNFTVTVRDNRSVGGGTTARDQLLTVNVIGTAGPFRVTQPNSFVILNGGGQATIAWNVANTNLFPISTTAVRILLSTDGGFTFPTVLAANTPNDGSQVVTLPAVQTSTARIKVEAVGNIYFDISDTNFTITNTLPNLTPFQPLGWSDKLVISTTPGNNTNSATLTTTDTLFIDWAATNNGAAPTNARFFTRIFVDGVERGAWFTDPPLSPGFFISVQDFSIGTLAAGSHTVRVVVDTPGAVAESNELDNEFIRTIVVSSPSTTLQFSATAFNSSESTGNASLTVTRSGSTASAASVDFATSDIAGLQSCSLANGRASERCDYVTSVGTVRFAAGEVSKTISIPLVNDVLVEGSETFTVRLSNAAAASLGSITTATVTIGDNDTFISLTNPIDGVEFFIRQQFLDILNRQPDSTGLQNWMNTLEPCPNGGFGEPLTSDCDRLHVARGFFLSDEFLNRGYWAFRFYMASLNQRPTYAQFMPDMARVGGPKSPAEEQASKVAFADAFVQRPAFVARYGTLTGQPLANAILQTAGLPTTTFTVTSGMTKGQILRGIIETSAVSNKFLVDGTVSIQYFGFLRRDPDPTGYQNNVNTLRASPSNLRHMIFIFIYSPEYRSRFGP